METFSVLSKNYIKLISLLLKHFGKELPAFNFYLVLNYWE